MNMHLRLQLPVEQWCLLWVPAGRPIHFSTRKKPMISWKSILREGWTVLHWTHFWWFKVLTSGVSMWSFRGPTLGWALTLFFHTSPTISRLVTPFVDGTAGSAAATADCTAGSRPFPGRNLDEYPWHCHCDIVEKSNSTQIFSVSFLTISTK